MWWATSQWATSCGAAWAWGFERLAGLPVRQPRAVGSYCRAQGGRRLPSRLSILVFSRRTSQAPCSCSLTPSLNARISEMFRHLTTVMSFLFVLPRCVTLTLAAGAECCLHEGSEPCCNARGVTVSMQGKELGSRRGSCCAARRARVPRWKPAGRPWLPLDGRLRWTSVIHLASVGILLGQLRLCSGWAGQPGREAQRGAACKCGRASG